MRFREAHRRALARAGPIALAFDFNLATFGFPYGAMGDAPLEVTEWVASTTSIGEGGAYLRKLAEEGRFAIFDFPKHGFPPQLGDVVITTSRPRKDLARSARQLSALVREGRSLCLVFGVGPRGIDDSEVYELGAHHFDVTERGLSLEMATAIEAVSATVSAHVREM